MRRIACPSLNDTNGSSGHLAQPHLPAARQRMRAGDDQHQLLVEDAHPVEAGLPGRHRHEHEVELTTLELLLDRGAIVLHEGKAHRAVGPTLKRRTSSGMNLAPSVRRKPSATAPRSGLCQIGELTPALLDLAERALDPRQEQLAVAGEPDRAAGPLEQRHADIGLQPRQRAAQRRLAGAELLGRAGDVLQPPGDAETFEQVPIGLGHAGLTRRDRTWPFIHF